MPDRPDPAELAIFNALFASIAEEMGVTLGRTAHSPNIKERRDYSCAVFDAKGRLVAQAAHIPVHLGAMPTAVQAAMRAARPEPRRSEAKARVEGFRPGDLVILNDPYLGGTHLPDITMVSPVFVGAEGRRRALAGFVASRAHHADVGGISPGSMPVAQELLQEGIVIPPLKLRDRGRLNQPALDLLLRNMRNPDERRGDLDAQTAAHGVGEARFADLVQRYGLPHVRRRMRDVMDYAERMTRAAIESIPDGAYEFQDALDDDGTSEDPVPIRLRLTVEGGAIHCDFTGSSPQRPSSVNAVAAVTRSAVYYVVRCLLDESVPSNDGCFRPVTFTLPEGSVVNAGPPAAVAAGNVETSQRIVDTVLGALSHALPDLIPAASAGTMNNVSIGAASVRPEPVEGLRTPVRPEPVEELRTPVRPEPLEGLRTPVRPEPLEGLRTPVRPEPLEGRAFAYYETIAGGAGASPTRQGLSAVHTHMTNTMNTPVEALEIAYPFRITEYALRRDSGGPGRHRGGDGLRRTYEFLADATVSLLSERRRSAPWGLHGGSPGQPGRNTLHPAHPEQSAAGGRVEGPEPVEGPRSQRSEAPARPEDLEGPAPKTAIELPSKTTLRVRPGDRLTIQTPGGGAWGEPE